MRYEVHVPSTYQGKKQGAEEAVKTYHAEHFPEEPAEVVVEGRKYPSGSGTPRPEQPFSITGFSAVEEAARERVAQVEAKLADEGDTEPRAGVRRLVIAPESGLKVNLRQLGVYDHTVTVAKDLDTGDTSVGVSDGVRFPLRDVIATALRKGGFREHTVGETYTQRMARRGITVDKQDPYVSMGHQSRYVFLEQSAKRAMAGFPVRS